MNCRETVTPMIPLGPDHLDALKEVANIASSHAVSRLSEILNRRLTIDVPSCGIHLVEELPELIDPSLRVVAVFTMLEGALEGMVFQLMDERDALAAVRGMKRTPSEDAVHDEGDTLQDTRVMHALLELGEAAAGAYTSAVAALLGIEIEASRPGITVDMLRAIMQVPACLLGETADSAIVIRSTVIGLDGDFRGWMLFIPRTSSTAVIFKRFGLEPPAIPPAERIEQEDRD